MLNGVRVILVDDHEVVRTSLGLLLSTYGIDVIGEASGGKQAVAMALEFRPDVIIMDISLPDLSGIEATRQICQEWPAARVLALTMYDEEEHLASFLEAGGFGYVRKAAADRDVLQAIETINRGDVFVQEEGVKTLIRHHRGKQGETPLKPEALSARERLVLKLTVRGFTSQEIGDQLGISPRTVDTYRSRLMKKIGLTRRHELVDYALKHDFIS